ncbi:MAG: hypothetical protein ABJD11_01430 [Gemmatimonadota bacterium]
MRGFAKALTLLLAVGMMTTAATFAPKTWISKGFTGVKANVGSVMATKDGDKIVLTLSDDFKVPDAPAPHWQIVDSKGNTYLLNRLVIKGDKYNKTITLPPYIKDVAKVQIWCAFAEVLLGEAPFDTVVK